MTLSRDDILWLYLQEKKRNWIYDRPTRVFSRRIARSQYPAKVIQFKQEFLEMQHARYLEHKAWYNKPHIKESSISKRFY